MGIHRSSSNSHLLCNIPIQSPSEHLTALLSPISTPTTNTPPTTTKMSGMSNVGSSGVYEAGDQVNYKNSEVQNQDRYNEGQANSHQSGDYIFAKYAGGDKKGITMGEVWTYMKGQRLYGDPIGWGAAGFEWIATWILLWPEDGRMKKDDIRRIYDGSLFFEIAARRKKQGGQRMINGS